MDKTTSIELAIKNETTERDYYLGQSQRSKNPLARALFATLAQDEEEHMKRLTSLHQKLVASGTWPENLPLEVAGTNVSAVLDGVRGRSEQGAPHDHDDVAALKRGIDFEGKAASFYGDLAGACKDPREVKFFKFLAGIEREHMMSIQDSLLYLENPQGWLAEKERSGLDGA